MTIRLHDSLSGATREFVPVVPGRASLYVCGPTVQSAPHIGHLRSALVYDLWRRWLEYRGLQVVLVRNVTDIDDKILHLATAHGEGVDRTGEEWWALAYRVEQEFSAAYRAIGVRPPTVEPRATANVDRMLALIERLIERGHAYRAADGSSDVYFDTASWPSYGELTRQRPEDMADAADADPRGKRDPRDFALWKGGKPEEPSSAHWPSPWGPGRPGWHIECSAMAERYLGDRFDIHGGGLDLRFPHHENELAQSRAAGAPFASYWVHNGLVTVGGRKMSKSLGNSVFAADLLASARPLAVRYALAAAHYRSVLDHQDGFLDEAEAALSRIEGFLERAGGAHDAIEVEVPTAFAAAMDDDLGVPQALAVLHGAVRAGNQALEADDATAVARLRGEVLAMTRVLGLDPTEPAWGQGSADAGTATALDALVTQLLDARRAARAERDFAAADRIRDTLAAAGVVVEDSATGSRWSLTGRAGADARPDGARNGDG